MAYGKTKAFLAGTCLTLIPLALQWDKNRQLNQEMITLKLESHRSAINSSQDRLQRERSSERADGLKKRDASPSTLVDAMAGSEFGGIDFSNLPTDQEGVDEIFVRIFSETSQTERKRLYALLLDSITPEQAPLLMNSMRLRGRLGVGGHEEYRWLVDRWGDIDGETVNAWAFKIDGDDGYKSSHITNIAIKAWTRNDPEAALNWLAAQEDIPLKTGMREGLLHGIMDYHPDRATELLAAMEATPAERTQANKLLATRISRMEGAEELDAWFAGLPADTPGRDEIGKHVTRIHIDHGVAHAVEWAQHEPARLTEVLQHYAVHSQEPLFEYYASQAGSIDSKAESALRHAADIWTNKNPDLMGVWLQEHMDSPNYAAVAKVFIDVIQPIDPDAAAAWQETIAE